MNISLKKILVVFALLAGFAAFEASAATTLREIEARLDARLESTGKSLDEICKLYADNNPSAVAELEEMIKKSKKSAEVEKGKKLLAEWKQKKQTELWLHHPGHAGGEYKVYIFNVDNKLESTLKNIATLHWQINSLIDNYTNAKNAADSAKQRGDYNKAKEASDLAQKLFNTSNEARQQNNKMIEQLLTRAIDKTTIDGPGMKLSGVNGEFIFFIVEVTNGGKYVRAWCSRASGGSELHISGQQIRCTKN